MRSIKIKQLLFYIVWQSISERLVICTKNAPNWALLGYLFSTPTLTRKIENNNLKKRKPMCKTTMFLVLKFNWFDSYRKLKARKNLQRAITHDQKFCLYWLIHFNILHVPIIVRLISIDYFRPAISREYNLLLPKAQEWWE